MISETTNNKNDANNLVAGRAGELTLYANTLTFDLLEHIFGQNGPFRETLKEFGVKVKDTSDSYLVLSEGKVYSNIKKEQEILWGNYPIKLEKRDGEIVSVVSTTLNPVKFVNYFIKSLHDSKLILSADKTLETCLAKYKYISEQTVKVVESKYIDEKSFLNLYKDITYISYAYEIFEIFNRTKKASTTRGNIPAESAMERDYIQQNDYLLANSPDFIETLLKLPNGFYLDDYKNLLEIYESTQGLFFIPGKIDTISNTEIVLQCLKNNVRLKSDSLLFVLNMTLIAEAGKKGISTIADKTLSQLF